MPPGRTQADRAHQEEVAPAVGPRGQRGARRGRARALRSRRRPCGRPWRPCCWPREAQLRYHSHSICDGLFRAVARDNHPRIRDRALCFWGIRPTVQRPTCRSRSPLRLMPSPRQADGGAGKGQGKARSLVVARGGLNNEDSPFQMDALWTTNRRYRCAGAR